MIVNADENLAKYGKKVPVFQRIPHTHTTEDGWLLQSRKTIGDPEAYWEVEEDGLQVPLWTISKTRIAYVYPNTIAQIKLKRLWNYDRDRHIKEEVLDSPWIHIKSQPWADKVHQKRLFAPEVQYRSWAGKATAGGFCSKASYMGALDLDFEDDAADGAADVFISVVRTLVSELPNLLSEEAARAFHYQIAERDAGGIHIFWNYPHPHRADAIEKTLKARLAILDTKYPQLLIDIAKTNAMRIKSFSELEVFPNSHHGFRLCPCGLRDVITDKLLEPSKNRLVDYVNWLTNPDRDYADLDFVLDTLRKRLKRPGQLKKPKERAANDGAAENISTSTNHTGQLTWKNNTARTIIQFFGGIHCPVGCLPEITLIMARLAPHFCDSKEQAAKIFDSMIRNLPREARACSSRLMKSDYKLVNKGFMAVLKDTWEGKKRQPNVGESLEKLGKSVKHWKETGFDPFDPGTWNKQHPKFKLRVEWTPDDLIDFNQEFGKVLGRKKVDCSLIASRIIEIVMEKEREENGISLGYWKIVFQEQLGIACGDNATRRHQKIVNAAKDLGLITVHQKPCKRLATRYSLGNRANERLGFTDQTLEKRLWEAVGGR